MTQSRSDKTVSDKFMNAAHEFLITWGTKLKNEQAKEARRKNLTDPGTSFAAPQQVVQPWVPKSRTAIGRLSYQLTKLPDLVVIKVEVYYNDTDNTWQRVTSRSFREKALQWYLKDKASSVDNIITINTRAGHLVDHVVVPLSGLDETRLRDVLDTFVPSTIPLTNGPKISVKGKNNKHTDRLVQCKITAVRHLAESDMNDKLYVQSLTDLIRDRADTREGMKESCNLPHTFFLGIPLAIEKQAKQTPTMMTMIQGYESQTSLHSTEYPILLRNQLSFDRKQKQLHLDFDLVAKVPGASDSPGRKPVTELLSDIFGHNMNSGNITQLLPSIKQLLTGLEVCRSYPRVSKSTQTTDTWDRPLKIITLQLAGPGTNLKDGRTVYEYFKQEYNLTFESGYLPLAGTQGRSKDGKPQISWFPLECLSLPENQILADCDILVPALKQKIKDFKFIGQNGKAMVMEVGKQLFDETMAARKLCAEEQSPRESGPLCLAEELDGEVKVDNPRFERIDPIAYAIS